MQTICIAGKNNIAVDGLNYLLENHPKDKIVFIPNQNDLGIDGWQLSFRKHALKKNIKQVSLEDMYDLDDLVFLSLEFDKIIKPNLFQSKNLFNIHFSMLPKYKGMYTSALPLLHGEKSSGVTLHRIDAGIDTGCIISQLEFEINFTDTARDLYFKYLTAAKKLLLKNIESILSGKFMCTAQQSIGASYYSKAAIDYSSLSIDFKKCAFEVANQLRAFTFREYQMPRFGEWQINGSDILESKSFLRPGSIVSEDRGGFIVSTIDYDLRLKKDYYPILWDAAENGDLSGVKSALEFVDNLDHRNNKGWSALIIASYLGRLPVVEVLLENGASVSIAGYNGTTPLMYAFSHYEKSGDSRVFHALLNHGAEVSTKDNNGKTLKDYMIERNCLNLIDYV